MVWDWETGLPQQVDEGDRSRTRVHDPQRRDHPGEDRDAVPQAPQEDGEGCRPAVRSGRRRARRVQRRRGLRALGGRPQDARQHRVGEDRRTSGASWSRSTSVTSVRSRRARSPTGSARSTRSAPPRATSSPRSRASAASSRMRVLDWFEVDWHREIVEQWTAAGVPFAVPGHPGPGQAGGGRRRARGPHGRRDGQPRGLHARGGARRRSSAPAASPASSVSKKTALRGGRSRGGIEAHQGRGARRADHRRGAVQAARRGWAGRDLSVPTRIPRDSHFARMWLGHGSDSTPRSPGSTPKRGTTPPIRGTNPRKRVDLRATRATRPPFGVHSAPRMCGCGNERRLGDRSEPLCEGMTRIAVGSDSASLHLGDVGNRRRGVQRVRNRV